MNLAFPIALPVALPPRRPLRGAVRQTASLRFELVLAALSAIALFLITGCGQPAVPAADPGAVVMVGELGTPLLLANGQSTVYARIRLTTLARPEKPRGPINVALAIDTSGSMEGAAIKEARKAALDMIDALKNGDRLAVIAFHTRTEVLLPSTELDEESRATVKQKIGQMQAQGTTDMAGGLEAALAEVQSHRIPQGVNRVVLLGDGIPNNPSPIESTARRALASGVAITTLGLGLDYDETLMGRIAEISGGRYRYVEGADKVVAFFREEMQRIDTVYGRNASAQLVAGPGVRIDAVVGNESSSGGSQAYVSLGDIARGDTRDILVRLTVTPRKAGVPIELLDAEIAFDDALESAGRLTRHVYLGAHTVAQESEVEAAKKPEIELAAALAEASATTLRAMELAKNGSYVRAREMLTQGSQAAIAQAKRTPSAALTKHADDMVAVAKDMPAADAPRAAPAADTGYEFQDDELNAESIHPSGEKIQMKSAPAPAQAPASVLHMRKMVHDEAYQMTH